MLNGEGLLNGRILLTSAGCLAYKIPFRHGCSCVVALLVIASRARISRAL
jgi:hypothetical protein